MSGNKNHSDELSPYNVIAVSFQDDNNAYEAMTALKELASQGQVELAGAAVVLRSESGQITEKDEVGDDFLEGTAGGGLIGLLIGIIGGPLGVLIGGATGVLVGSLFDMDDEDETESVLSDISRSVRQGHTALLAQVTEQSPEVIDTAMGHLGGTVLRRPMYEVEAEIAAAEEAQREAKRKARKELRHARHKKHDEKVHAEVEKLKAKLHGDKPPAKTAS
jgi:uncharacterized membrane protein